MYDSGEVIKVTYSIDEESFKDSMLYKVAWLYYNDELTQKEIADKLSINRVRVIRMLEEARKKKIVSFNFSTISRGKLTLEKQLIDKYNLKDIFIVPWNAQETLAEDLGKATALYLDSFIKDKATIGVGYGETMGSFLKNLSRITEKELSVVSMTGGVTPYIRQIGNNIVDLKHYLIPTPLILSKKELAQSLLQEPSVQKIKEKVHDSDVIVTSLGGMKKNATVIKSGILNQIEFEKLKDKKAIGDILMHFVDCQGNIVNTDIEERIISTDLDIFMSNKNVIVAAGGDEKIDIIKTALIKGLVSILIIDERTAKFL